MPSPPNCVVRTFRLPHLPEYSIYIDLFRSTQNAAFLRQQLLDGNPEFEYAFLDATVVLSATHLLAAIFRAINDFQHQRLKSRNVHSEIVFCLSPNNNIADSFRRFGITDTTTSLLAVKLGLPDTANSPTAISVSDHLSANVSGEPVSFTDEAVAELSDLPKIKKIYKVAEPDGGGAAGKKGKRGEGKRKRDAASNGCDEATAADVPRRSEPDAGVERLELESVVLGMMALRGS